MTPQGHPCTSTNQSRHCGDFLGRVRVTVPGEFRAPQYASVSAEEWNFRPQHSSQVAGREVLDVGQQSRQ